MLAGKTRSNTLAAILSNTEDLEAAYESAMHAEGSAWAENEKYLDSIQGRIDLFNNAMQTMWNNTLDDDVVKAFVDIGTQLVKWVDNLGLIKTLFMAIGTFAIKKYFNGDLWGGLFGNKTQDIDQMKQTLAKLQKVRDEAASALANSPNSKSRQDKFNRAQSALDNYEKSMAPQIKEYDTLNEKLKTAQANLDKYQNRLNNYQGTNQQTIKKYQSDVAKAKQEVNNLESELKRVEAQTKKTGNAGMTASQKIKAGFKSAGKAVLEFSKQMLKSMAYMFVITTTIELVGTGIKELIDWINDTGESMENLQEKFEDAKGKAESLKSEIDNLESELKSTEDRIEELMDMGTLTYVEQEELGRLQTATKELEHQIKLKKDLHDSLQRGANDAAIVAANKYMDTSFANEKSRTEAEEEGAKKGGFWGKLAGVALTIGGLALAPFSGGTSTAATVAGLGMLGLGMAAPTIGESIGASAAGSKYDKEQSVGEAVANMNKERDALIKARDEALAAYASGTGSAEAYNAAEQELTEYNANLAKAMTQIAEYRNQIVSDWDNATPAQQEQARAWGDILDSYSIMLGTNGAKSSALDRIFGKEADDKLVSIKTKIEDAVDEGEDFQLKDILTNEEYELVLTRLRSIGIGAGDIIGYFSDAHEAAEDSLNNISTIDAVKEIANLTEGVNELKNAFDELRNSGRVSAESIVSLAETFSGVDGIDKLISMLSTGAFTIEQLTGQAQIVAENYLNGLSVKNLDDKDYLTIIDALSALGLQDPEKYLKALLEKRAAEDIASGKLTKDAAIDAYSVKNDKGEIIVAPELDEATIEASQKKANAEQRLKDIKDKRDAYLQHQNDISAADAAVSAYAESYRGKEQEFNDLVTRINNLNIEHSNLKNKTNSTQQDAYRILEIEGELRTLYGSQLYKDYQSFVDGYIDLTNTAETLKGQEVEFVSQDAIDSATAQVEQATLDWQEELDQHGLVANISLVDPSALIDDLQGLYDTLTSAAKEYAENGGYVSVDTLQTLLGLEPKYIGLLLNEHGQLDLNTESIQRLTQARVIDAAVIEAKSYLTDLENAALIGNTYQLDALTSATELAIDSEWGFVDAKLASIKATMLANGVSDEAAQRYIDNAYHNIMSMKKLADETNANIKNAISSNGNNAKDQASDEFQKAMSYWENRIGAEQSRFEQVQNEIDLLEKQGKIAGEDYYQEQIDSEDRRLLLLQQQKEEAKKYLGQFAEGSDEWWDAANTLNDIENAIDDVTLSIQDLYNDMAEVDWKVFDEFHKRTSSLHDELSTVRDLLAPNEEEDWFDDDGMWTDKGTAYLATYISDLQLYEKELANVNEKLADYSLPYAGNEETYKELGIDSEQELYDAREKLIGQQHDYQTSIVDTQQSVKDMYESQIDAVEEWADEAIEAYQDYIDVVTEALDAERD